MATAKEQLFAELSTVSTVEQYKRLVQGKAMPTVIDQLPGGGCIGWFGSRTAKKVFGYIPGGGLVLNAMPQHMQFIHNIYDLRVSMDADFAVAILCYSTALTASYPTPLRQVCVFVEHLMNGRDTSDIDMLGDSSGGSLIIQFLLHIIHPQPKVNPFKNLTNGNLLGRILLMSPLAPIPTSSVLKRQPLPDDLSPQDVLFLYDQIKKTKEADCDLVNPWLTPSWVMYEDWYTTLAVGEITIVNGSLDILSGEIERLSNVIQEKHSRGVRIVVDENAGHVPCIAKPDRADNQIYTAAVYEWVKNGAVVE